MEGNGPEQKRAAPRSSLFLTAMIDAPTGRSNVRIRNLSETGALLEGPAFPPVRSIFRLIRQELEIEAEVVWIEASQCGVKFRGQVAIAEWISGRRGATEGQARVDAIQAAVRSGTSIGGFKSSENRAAQMTPLNLDELIAQEIAYVQRLLENASDDLIGNPIVVNRHAQALQAFDIANQILGHLARIIQAPDRAAAIGTIGMEELRARLLRKPIA